MRDKGKDRFLQILSVCLLIFAFSALLLNSRRQQTTNISKSSTPAPTPTPIEPFPYKLPQIPNDRSYRTMLVGDSMIASLGPNAPLLREHLIELYPEHEFVNYNYGFGSTNIQTLPRRLTNTTYYNDQQYQPILTQGFDLIIIGSFAYNPLSQLGLSKGLTEHIRILDESVREIIMSKPESAVAIMLPIAPSKTHFAQGVYDLSPAERSKWANERISYINAVSDYAKEKQIPLINVYQKSLDSQGEANLKYINHDDYIHPSVEGVDLMSRTIAEFIYTNSIFPE